MPSLKPYLHPQRSSEKEAAIQKACQKQIDGLMQQVRGACTYHIYTSLSSKYVNDRYLYYGIVLCDGMLF